MPRNRKFDFKVQIEEPEGSGNFSLLTLSGTLVVIPNYENFYFVFHKFPTLKYNVISELTTGARIVDHCKTKAVAINEAKIALDYFMGGDHAKFKRRIRYVRDHKIKVKGWKGNPLPQDRLL